MCRTRHLRAADLAVIAAAVAGPERARASQGIMEAIASQALWVYRNHHGGCSERKLREEAQLLYDIATLEPLGEASVVAACLAVLCHQALNGEPLAGPARLVEAVEEARRGSRGPEDIALSLKGSMRLPSRPRGVLDALRALAEAGVIGELLGAIRGWRAQH